MAEHLATSGPEGAVGHLREACGLEADAAEQIVAYLSTGLEQLGVMPGHQDVVFERFFDDAGGMQLVVHSPLGGRVNGPSGWPSANGSA